MKRFFIGIIIVLCVQNAIAGTTQWYVDGSVYQTTTCSSGDDVTPPTPPTKYGYTFAGWKNTALIRGTWSQSGTPTPSNPIYPTFYQNGDLILRAIGTGNNLYQDTYNQDTGKITRNVGIKVLDGTENYAFSSTYGNALLIYNVDGYWRANKTKAPLCTHYTGAVFSDTRPNFTCGFNETGHFYIRQNDFTSSSVSSFKQWLAAQYAAGTPVTIYYPLETPVEENYTQN